jgi:Protein of unknown function (DUF1587)
MNRSVCGPRITFTVVVLSLVVMGQLTCTADDAADASVTDTSAPENDTLKADAEKVFRKRVAPFIKEYCIDCHQSSRPTEGGVNFTPALDKPWEAAFTQQWKKAVARVRAHDMPPEDVDEQPDDQDRQAFIDGVEKLKYLSPKDPGPFVIRRLTKVEYSNTLRDLFGVDPSIAADLPDDVSGAGYLNSLTPLQMEHYLSISKNVLDRMDSWGAPYGKELRERLTGRSPKSDEEARSEAENIARSMARRAFRRPPLDGVRFRNTERA